MNFKQKHSLELRKKMYENIIKKYPERIPVIVEPYKNDKNLPQLDKTKFLVPYDITLDKFRAVVYNRLSLHPSESMYLFCNKKLMSSGHHRFYYLYSFYKDEDGFMYFNYSLENTYG